MVYPNAPIKEAVFDIQVDRLNILDANDLHKFSDLLEGEFPKVKKRHQIKGQIKVHPDNSIPLESETQTDLIGFAFLNEAEDRQLQIKMDGITLNILKPYQTWENHFQAFMKYWEIYREMFEPSKISRISARFLNRIDLPFPIERCEDYFTNMPPIPECLPQTFHNFFMQIQVPTDDGLRNVILTETFEPVQENILPFILDIDVIQEASLSEENIVENFNAIRTLKNQVFENCITDKTRNLFK